MNASANPEAIGFWSDIPAPTASRPSRNPIWKYDASKLSEERFTLILAGAATMTSVIAPKGV